MNVLEIIDYSVPVLEALIYFMLFEALLMRRHERSIYGYFIGVVALACAIGVCRYFFLHDITNIIMIALAAFLIAAYFYDGALSKKIMVVAFALLLSGVTEILVTSFLAAVLNTDIQFIIDNLEYRSLGIVLSKTLALAIGNTIRVKTHARHFEAGTAYWVLFFLLGTSTLFTIFVVFDMAYNLREHRYNIMVLICLLGLLFSTFFALYLYERLSHQSEAIRIQGQREVQLESQLKYVEELSLKQEALQKFKHDISYQLVALEKYYEVGDFETGAIHVKKLRKCFNESIPEFDTGNIALDAIISSKEALALQRGIQFDRLIQISEQLDIDPVDVCSIFGNILDNAIEACVRSGYEHQYIKLVLIQQDESLFCKLENTMNAALEETLRERGTSKEDKYSHGYGTMNVKKAMETYNSQPIVTMENNTYQLIFTLFFKS